MEVKARGVEYAYGRGQQKSNVPKKIYRPEKKKIELNTSRSTAGDPPPRLPPGTVTFIFVNNILHFIFFRMEGLYIFYEYFD